MRQDEPFHARVVSSVASMTERLDGLISNGWSAPPEDVWGVPNCNATDGSDVSFLEGGLEVIGLEGGNGFCIGRRFDVSSGFGSRQGGKCG